MYNESDLRTVWQAAQNRMKPYQLAEMMGTSQEEIQKMLAEARKLFLRIRKEKDAPPVEKGRRPFFRDRVIPIKTEQPFTRPAAKYDNKSAEERIEELLNTEV